MRRFKMSLKTSGFDRHDSKVYTTLVKNDKKTGFLRRLIILPIRTSKNENKIVRFHSSQRNKRHVTFGFRSRGLLRGI